MPLLWLSLVFLVGVLLGEALGVTWLVWSLLASLLIISIFLRPWLARFSIPNFLKTPVPMPWLALFVCLGAIRYQLAQPVVNPGFIAWYNDSGKKIVVEGMLVEPPDQRDTYANLRVSVTRLRPLEDQLFTPVQGLLLAKVPPDGNWRYGDLLRLEGQLETPAEAEEFSYRDYLARQGIYSTMQVTEARLLLHDQGNPLLALIYRIKANALVVIYRIFPDPEASLMAGILLGVESGIPLPVQEAFKDTGTSHIIAISGFNITILAGLFAAIFGRLLGKRRRFLGAGLSISAISAYTVLVGAEAAVVRAAIMGGLSVFARQVGRRQDGLNSLGLIAGVMALANPQVLWDIGFQLSFMATLGLVLYADPFSQAFVRWASHFLSPAIVQRLAGPVGEYFLFTLAAQLTTLPVTIYHFQRLSLSSLLVNPLILPVQPAVMILSGIAMLLGMISQPLGQIAAYLSWPFVVYTIRAVELLARLPGGVITLGSVSLLVVGLFYAMLLAWTFWGQMLSGWLAVRVQPGARPALSLFASVALIVLAVIVWRVKLSAPDGRLHLTVLDVGSGDALLVQTPTGRSLLVDGGPSTSLLSDALGRRLPLLQRKLDWVVVAAANDEQLAALPRNLERYPMQNVLWSGPPLGSVEARQLQASLGKAGVPITVAQTGHSLDLGSGAVLRLLAVSRRGAVLLLEWGSFRALLPIGLDFDTLESLQDDPELNAITALLLADCGYAPVNPPEWIAKLGPQVVLLSVGAGDSDGRPSPETLEAVSNYSLLRTDRNGWIELSTDGEQLWVEVERK
jgi:competence protein ComEC